MKFEHIIRDDYAPWFPKASVFTQGNPFKKSLTNSIERVPYHWETLVFYWIYNPFKNSIFTYLPNTYRRPMSIFLEEVFIAFSDIHDRLQMFDPSGEVDVICDGKFTEVESVCCRKKRETKSPLHACAMSSESQKMENRSHQNAYEPHPTRIAHDKKINIRILIRCVHRERITDRHHTNSWDP